MPVRGSWPPEHAIDACSIQASTSDTDNVPERERAPRRRSSPVTAIQVKLVAVAHLCPLPSRSCICGCHRAGAWIAWLTRRKVRGDADVLDRTCVQHRAASREGAACVVCVMKLTQRELGSTARL